MKLIQGISQAYIQSQVPQMTALQRPKSTFVISMGISSKSSVNLTNDYFNLFVLQVEQLSDAGENSATLIKGIGMLARKVP
jgi:hypothetical protein